MNIADNTDIRPFTEQESSWIHQNWEMSTRLLMTIDSDALTREYLLTRANWEQTPEDQRPPAEHAVVGLGALAGQYICNHTDLEWGVRGTGPEAKRVIHNPEGLVITPMQQVAAIWTGASTQTSVSSSTVCWRPTAGRGRDIGAVLPFLLARPQRQVRDTRKISPLLTPRKLISVVHSHQSGSSPESRSI